MKHISTIIDDLDLNEEEDYLANITKDDLAYEYELDRRNDEFFDAEAEMERRFEEEVERRYQARKEVRNG